MSTTMFEASQLVIGMIENLMASSITFSGEENLDDDYPTLFVANHFTRIETFLLPYALYSKFGFKVRSLADHSIFTGLLSDYLSSVGTVSTKDEKRDEKILGDLLTGREHWLIYPEGSMIKSKKVLLSEETFLIEDIHGMRNMFTGSAVLAIKSELEKSKYFEALNRCEEDVVKEFKKKYFIDDSEELSHSNTRIIPINISYTPIRTGENTLLSLADKYIGSDKDAANEEINVESNILINSSLHIHFSKPIDTKDFLLKTKRKLKEEDLDLDDDTVIQMGKVPLTNMIMNSIYKNIYITFDHLFALCLEYIQEEKFTIHTLKIRIYLIARELKTLEIYHLDSGLDANLYKLLNCETHPLFDDILSVAIEQEVLVVNGDECTINQENFKNQHSFHSIRLKNILRVLINETIILHELQDCVKKEAQKDIKKVHKEVFYIMYNRDVKQFKYDYSKFYSVLESKPKEIGKPFIMYDEKNTIGCVLSHGYLSAPREIEPLAKYLFAHGINVYGVRLKGHGTMPEDLRDTSYKDWYDSLDIGYAALSCVSEKIFLCGFSTGGLLSLLKASNVDNKIDGIICINCALSLEDIYVNYVYPALNFLSIFNADFETYETKTEHPEINYKMNYSSSVDEWKEMVEAITQRLEYVIEPTLIIQADKDPIVDSKSADIIYDTIASKDKKKFIISSDNHEITLQEGVNQEVFEEIRKFITTLSS